MTDIKLTRRGKIVFWGMIILIGFLIGMLAPWDSLPWNRSLPACSETITIEDGYAFCDG